VVRFHIKHVLNVQETKSVSDSFAESTYIRFNWSVQMCESIHSNAKPLHLNVGMCKRPSLYLIALSSPRISVPFKRVFSWPISTRAVVHRLQFLGCFILGTVVVVRLPCTNFDSAAKCLKESVPIRDLAYNFFSSILFENLLHVWKITILGKLDPLLLFLFCHSCCSSSNGHKRDNFRERERER
jgi:hypothetical protein